MAQWLAPDSLYLTTGGQNFVDLNAGSAQLFLIISIARTHFG
jgi:hypothetical protein